MSDWKMKQWGAPGAMTSLSRKVNKDAYTEAPQAQVMKNIVKLSKTFRLY
jgi:hypothetical protein